MSPRLHENAARKPLRRVGAVLAAMCVLAFGVAACTKSETAANTTGKDGASLSGPDDETLSADGASSGTVGGEANATRPVGPVSVDASTWAIKPPFYAAGDEPFWRLELEDGWFSFKRSGLSAIEAPVPAPTASAKGDVFDAAPMKITLKPGDCQSGDGRSGSGVATVAFDGVDYEGCVFAAGAATSGSAQAGAITDALVQIDGCIAKLGEPALVTGLYPREESLMSMGLRTRDGRLYECAAQPTGEVAFLDPIEPNSASSWITAGLRFLRDGQMGVKVDCADGEVVQSASGRLGVILTRKCKF